MLTKPPLASAACVLLLGSFVALASARAVAQGRESIRPDLSGRWQFNADLSENAQAKLEGLHTTQGSGHGPGRHGLGGLFGGAPSAAQVEEARGLLLKAPSWFTVRQEGERIVLTDSDGRAQTLTTNGRKERVNGRDVRTRWDQDRLDSEISLGSVKITETYERSRNDAQLVVTTRMNMRGHDVSVRRIYDAGAPGDQQDGDRCGLYPVNTHGLDPIDRCCPTRCAPARGRSGSLLRREQRDDHQRNSRGCEEWPIRMAMAIENSHPGPEARGEQEKQLVLKTDTDTIHVHVGPAAFLTELKLEIRKGDTLEVTGSFLTIRDSQVVLAREIRKGDLTWTLRTASGLGLWNTTPPEQRRFWTTTKVVLIAVGAKVALLATVLRH